MILNLTYSGQDYDTLHKFYIFLGGYALEVEDQIIKLSPYKENQKTRTITEILSESTDVSEYTGTNNWILVPFGDRLSFDFQLFTEQGNEVKVYSSDSGFPFISSDRKQVTTPTNGVLQGVRCIYLSWSSNTFIKSVESFSNTNSTLPWAFLSSLKPLYIIVRVNQPKIKSSFFNDFIFDKNPPEIYQQQYYAKWV